MREAVVAFRKNGDVKTSGPVIFWDRDDYEAEMECAYEPGNYKAQSCVEMEEEEFKLRAKKENKALVILVRDRNNLVPEIWSGSPDDVAVHIITE